MKDTFVRYLTHKQILFKYARGNLNIQGSEIHPFHEILLFMDGDATFVSDEYKMRLHAPCIVIIPKETFHQFIVADENKYERYVFNFPDIAELNEPIQALFDNIKVVENTDMSILSLFDELRDNMDNHSVNKAMLFAVLSLVLIRLSKDIAISDCVQYNTRADNEIISKIIQHIGISYLTNPSIDEIAQALYISKSKLSHIFKNEMGISVHRYINDKRLIYAHKLLKNGMLSHEAASASGFSDYSTFYRAYKKYFKKSPTDAKKEHF